MPENPESESPPLDAEDWDVVFQPYAGYPILALILAQHLTYVKELIQGNGIGEATTGLDLAIESLFPHTLFRDAGHKTYLLAVAGNLSPERETALMEAN